MPDPSSTEPSVSEHPFDTLKALLRECTPYLEHLNRAGREQPITDLLKRIAITLEHPACTAGAGVRCPHCSGSGTAQVCCQVLDTDEEGAQCCQHFTEGACETCYGVGRLFTVEQYLKTLPADWNSDSSLERWFPLSAEELLRLHRERDELSARLRAVSQK